MKIVLCGSRYSPEIKKLTDKNLTDNVLKIELDRVSLSLTSEDEERKNPQKKAFCYFCEDDPTNLDAYKKKQEEIFERISEADWVIVVAPLNHFGSITYEEICKALEAQKRHPGYPVLTVFKCTDYYKYKENQKKELGYGDTDFDPDLKPGVNKDKLGYFKVSVARLEKELGYFAEYDHDPTQQLTGENKLGDAIHKQLVLNLLWKKFRTQHLMFKSVLGKDVIARDLYSDPKRADFIKNEYLTRGSVDWNLGNAINDKRKYIVITGVPGSGKTRAVMEALKPCDFAGNEDYSMGVLSRVPVIVVTIYNVNEIYRLLQREHELMQREQELPESPDDNAQDLKTVYLLIDQIRDVFGMLNDEDLFNFFDLLDKLPYIKLIATSLKDAFDDLCARWGERTLNPLTSAEAKAGVIEIPLISNEKEEEKEQIRAHFSDYPNAESIGECIPELAKYKEGIVQSVYDNKEYKSEITCLLKSIQTVETFRRGEMALFLPYMIATTLLDDDYDKKRMIEAVKYLINHRVLKVTNIKDNTVISVFGINCFINSKMSDGDEYVFDGEKYDKPIISTKYRYTLNEIAWKYIAEVDEEKNEGDKVLWNYKIPDEITESAKSLFVTVQKPITIRRIMSRVPRQPQVKTCHDDAVKSIRVFLFEELKKLSKDDPDFISAAATLISHSIEVAQINEILDLLKEKDIAPNYACIAGLYNAAIKNDDIASEVDDICNKLKKENGLDGDSIYSFSRRMVFENSEFYSPEKPDIYRKLNNSNIKFYYEDGTRSFNGFIEYVNNCREEKNEKELYSIDEAFAVFASRVKDCDDIDKLLEIYRDCQLCIRAKVLRKLISKLADLDRSKLKDFFPGGKNEQLIDNADREYPFVVAIQKCKKFVEAHQVYDSYYNAFQQDNPKLISMAMQSVQDNEFQTAISFLREVEMRRKEKKQVKLSGIVYNSLLKQAPALAEAFTVLPLMTTFQTHTIANMLYVIRKRRNDPKGFFFAYDVWKRMSNMPGNANGLWQSPYIIGSLLPFAKSLKHEEFIQKTILSGLANDIKCQLIDYSTMMSSMRIRKLYRSIDEAWDVFDKCYKYRFNGNQFINSDLFSSMMSKLASKHDEKSAYRWETLRQRIATESERIKIDDHFYPNWYAYDPEKRKLIFDFMGNLSKQFKADIESVPVRSVNVFNSLLKGLFSQRDSGEPCQFKFNHFWTLYEYIVQYYKIKNRRKALSPDSETYKFLFMAVSSQDDFQRIVRAAQSLLGEDYLKSDSCRIACLEAAQRLNVKVSLTEKIKKNQFDFKDCIKKVQEAFEAYQVITPTLINNQLNEIFKIANKSSFETAQNIFGTLKNELLDNPVYSDKLPINSTTCISIIKIADLAGCFMDVKDWIKKLKDLPEEQYMYNADHCRELANMPSIAGNDLLLSRKCFEYWKRIMHDIGSIPKNDGPDLVDVNHWVKKSDDYWHVCKRHLMREMEYYYDHINKMSESERKELFQEIINQMNYFKKNNIRVPNHTNDDIGILITAEIADLQEDDQQSL